MPKKSNPDKTADSTPSNVTIYNYPKALCHEHADPDGSIFYSVSFKFKDDWASFIVSRDDIQQAVKQRNNEIIPDRVNILLGASDDIRSVSVRADDGESYISQPMFNSTICSCIASDRKNYLRSIAV